MSNTTEYFVRTPGAYSEDNILVICGTYRSACDVADRYAAEGRATVVSPANNPSAIAYDRVVTR
jgi:hypothetical protein